ncbi:MAG: cupin domain-containing protein [Spirochaetaceae bacterium]|nr:MAG: cupin domain-containing protein [Spirochaetaceae bacterium]
MADHRSIAPQSGAPPTRPRPTVQQLTERFRLQPLPEEGGLYTQSYLSADMLPADALPPRYAAASKPAGTAIYYLLSAESNSFSALHRLPTDEIYHFYLGDPMETLLLFPDGSSRIELIGPDVMAGQHVQFVVPAGVWQGSSVAPGGEYSLIGTTMAPGYTMPDYVGGVREELIARYPDRAEGIRRLTR